jgi:hypothetical protein
MWFFLFSHRSTTCERMWFAMVAGEEHTDLEEYCKNIAMDYRGYLG